ncbi:MAG: transposase [Bacteroidetes bacterium]|nr:MAG: transposase [Bacteroidota bacterium]
MITLEMILIKYLPEYITKYWDKMLPGHKKTIQDILSCRTKERGGQTWFCDNCKDFHYSYHSCKNRMCPKCQNNQATNWLSKQMKQLLPVKYFMVTFTIPKELRTIFRSNQKKCYNILFKASSESLRKIAMDKRFIGGQIGMIGILQTWAANLIFHPHIHYIVPGIAISNNNILFPKNKHLVHCNPLIKKYRGKLIALLEKNNLYVTPKIWDKNWVVDIRNVGNGINSLKYLSKYIYRTAISNKNILSDENGKITFRYKNNNTKNYDTISLPAMEFIRRFLQHTLPKGFQKVRYFGLLHPKKKSTLYLLQLLLKADIQKDNNKKNVFKCPKCGKEMILITMTNRNRAPPVEFYFPTVFNIAENFNQNTKNKRF